MLSPAASYLLTPFNTEGRLLLVPATEGIRLCREGGYEEVPAYRAACHLDGLGRRELTELRQFLAGARLSGPPLSSLTDETLLALLRRSVQCRELTVLREGEGTASTADAGVAEQRRLVRAIEGRTGRRLSYQGRTYRLVADVDLNRLPDRDYYEVVRREDADRVLAGLAEQGAGPAEQEALAKARTKLTADWRPPLSPDGLILLRRLPTTQPVPRTEEPITPSQLAKLLGKDDWIEIEVVYDNGRPFRGKYRLTHPDSHISEGRLDNKGLWSAYHIDSGTYQFAVPQPEEEPGVLDDEPADEATRVRLSGMLFDANKCFLLPQALPGIKTIVATHQDDPTAEVLLVGHAGGDEDLAGADIAYDRAVILGAYLKSLPGVWLNWFGPDKPARSRWGTREVQLMLSALPEGGAPFYQGYASGVTDAATTAALKAFQEQAGLPANGKADFATRKALVEAYMGLEDTSLTEGVTPVAHGCEGHCEDTPTASGAAPDDRRLEVFFFKKAIEPRPDQTTSSGAALYGKWLAKLVETKDFEHHGIHVQIIDAKKQPAPFATVHLTGPVSADATTDEHGFVSFSGLLPGDYTLSSEKNGYKIGVSKLRYPTAKTVTGYGKTASTAAPA